MKRLSVLALIVAMVLVSVVADDEPMRSVDPEGAEMAELLDRALYLAIAALSWPDKDDLTLYIQGVINLLDGPSSPDCDASGGATMPDGDGLKDLLLALQVSGLTTTEVEPVYLQPSRVVQVAQALEHMEMYLFMAAGAAKEALKQLSYYTGGLEELRAMYAYLLAARGRANDELVLGGLQALVDLYPALDVWVGSDVSIQAAIDRAPPGSTIHLDPGTYRERIVIDKDLILVGAPRPAGDAGPPATVITGAAWDFVVAIEGDGVDVRLENLRVTGGLVGIAVSGDNTAWLDRVWVESVNTALSVYGGASVDCDACWLNGEEAGMILRSNTDTRVLGSRILAGGVALFSDSSLTMTDTSVSECDGHAVYLQGDASLHLERCSIYDNEGFGVLGYSTECVPHYLPGSDPEHDFSGTITGANNTIPGSDEEHGNLGGDICPEEFRFLKGGGPIIVPPGESD